MHLTLRLQRLCRPLALNRHHRPRLQRQWIWFLMQLLGAWERLSGWDEDILHRIMLTRCHHVLIDSAVVVDHQSLLRHMLNLISRRSSHPCSQIASTLRLMIHDSHGRWWKWIYVIVVHGNCLLSINRFGKAGAGEAVYSLPLNPLPRIRRRRRTQTKSIRITIAIATHYFFSVLYFEAGLFL